ncbi:MAG: phosphate ABC transporter substrate-binding protein PstS [Actinomycetota bacterium]|nr:phosphate ABC transporter substrate-binding protein PstS [Actinomycetota bacterium]
MKLYRAGVIAGLIAGAVVLAACSSSKSSNTATSGATTGATPASTGAPTCSSGKLNAQGSTAQTNAINAWIRAYQTACPGATINYNPTGSGAGVTGFIANQNDFVGSDSALSPSKGEYAKAQTRCGSAPMDLPMVVGPIAIAYKLAGVDKLILNGSVTAQIFLGKITKWNDSAIAALNPGVTLPATTISVIFRSDSSGTTQNFENYLKATAPAVFTSTPDKDSSKAGFAGQGKAKSQGVSAAIASTEGAIGYDEFSFAVASGLQTAQIDNGGGPVTLSKDSASAAALAAKVASSGPGDLSLKINYAEKTPGAYPIILVTYEIVCTKYSSSTTGSFVKNFLTYTATGGQAALPGLGYAPLPPALQSQVESSIATIS